MKKFKKEIKRKVKLIFKALRKYVNNNDLEHKVQEQKKEIVMQMKKYLKEPKHIDISKSEQTLSKDQNKSQESQYPYTTI